MQLSSIPLLARCPLLFAHFYRPSNTEPKPRIVLVRYERAGAKLTVPGRYQHARTVSLYPRLHWIYFILFYSLFTVSIYLFYLFLNSSVPITRYGSWFAPFLISLWLSPFQGLLHYIILLQLYCTSSSRHTASSYRITFALTYTSEGWNAHAGAGAGLTPRIPPIRPRMEISRGMRF